MTRRVLASLFLAMAALALVARAQPPDTQADPKKPDLDLKAAKSEAVLEQERLAREFREFKHMLLVLKQRLEKSDRPEDRERAAILEKALAVASKAQVDNQFAKLLDALRDEKELSLPELQKIAQQNKELASSIGEILKVMNTADQDAERRRKIEEYSRMLEKLKEVIRQQKNAQAWNERKLNNALRAQRDVTENTRGLLKDKNKSEAKPGDLKGDRSKTGEGKGEGKNDTKENKAGDKSEGKDSGKDSQDGKTGESKESGKDGEGKDGKPGEAKQGDAKDGKPSEAKDAGKDGGKDGKPSEAKDAQPGDGKQGQSKEGKPGDEKQGKSKAGQQQGEGKQGEGKQGEGKQGEGKQGEGKQGEGKQGEGKQGEGKQGGDKKSEGKGEGKDSGKDSKPSEAKGEGKQGEGKPGEGKKDAKPDGDNKPGEGKQSKGDSKGKSEGKGEGKGQPSAGKPSQGSQGQQGQSKGSKSSQQQQGGSKNNQQQQQQQQPGQQGQQGQPGQQGQQQPQQNKQGEQDSFRKKIQDAEGYQNKAEDEIEKKKNDDASKDQSEALNKLEEAQKKLEELLRQLRQEEIERVLAALQARCQKMLDMQVAVRNGTVGAYKDLGDGADKRVIQQRTNTLSDDEDKIVLEANKAIQILESEGTAVAFPEMFKVVRRDMLDVSTRLRKTEVGVVTQVIEQDIIDNLTDMIKALKKARQENQQNKQQQQQQQGQPADPKLIDLLAELKMIRAMQVRINRRTETYGKEYEGLEQLTPEKGKNAEERDKYEMIQRELKGLAESQLRVEKITNDIAKRRNEK